MSDEELEPCPITAVPCDCPIVCSMQMALARTMLDAEKHMKAMRETGCYAAFLPAAYYAMAEKLGYDMTRYVIQHPMPTSAEMRERVKRDADAGLPLGANHVHTCGLCGGPLPCLTHMQLLKPVPGSITKNGNPEGSP